MRVQVGNGALASHNGLQGDGWTGSSRGSGGGVGWGDKARQGAAEHARGADEVNTAAAERSITACCSANHSMHSGGHPPG